MPSQEYFLALQRRSHLRMILQDLLAFEIPASSCDYAEGKKKSSQQQISCGVNADTCLPPFSSTSAEICFSLYVPAFFFPPIFYLAFNVYFYGFISFSPLFITSFVNFKFVFSYFKPTGNSNHSEMKFSCLKWIIFNFHGASSKSMNYCQV